MPVTIAPATEACQAIVAQINAGSGIAYTLSVPAVYGYLADQQAAATDALAVFVIHQGSNTLEESLDFENRTTHNIAVVVRQHLSAADELASIDQILLITRQLFQRLNNWDSSNGRVRVWECDAPPEEIDKEAYRQLSVGEASFLMRVEVEASP